MSTFRFPVELQGSGEGVDDAWRDACESFGLDPGDTPGNYDELLEPGKIIVTVEGGIAYCDDPRVEIIDHDNREDADDRVDDRRH